ncbi:MAG: GGDEF domain-containing protein, partial [Pusillimonas sp.]|nr:GGDEF domain-containing protein [Pusillimonas sp.]
MREMHRLIRHSDRTEAELNVVNARLQQLSAELEYKAHHDPLTGTLNRGAVFELAKSHLSNAPMSLIMLDIDHFKRINDTFGHPTGDAVLKELIYRLKTTLNQQGDIGRVGGEEF